FIMGFLGFVAIPAEKNISTIEDRRVDILGISSFTIGVVTVIYYLSEGPSAGWAVASTLVPLCVGVALLICFIVIEYKIDYPIMPLRIWRSRRLVASCIIIICVSAGINAIIFFTSLTFQNVQGYSSIKTSLAYIVQGVGAIASIVALTKLVTMVRTKFITIVGWLFFIGSSILFAQIQVNSSYWSVAFPGMILNFLGMAPIWLCCQINSVADANNEDQGVVGAVYNVSMQIGAPIGIAITNIVANARNSPTAVGAELLPGYHAAFYTCVIMGGVGLVATIIFAANNDVHKTPEVDVTEVAAISAGAGEEDDLETGQNSEILEIKKSESSEAEGATISRGSSTSLSERSEKKAEVK
ncbi:hypothetical protein BGZ79_005992, partial [Entomortierella chlamydospora]